MTGLSHLRELFLSHSRTRYPNMPESVRSCRNYLDKTANDLTKCVTIYIQFKGGFASRISNQGTYNQKLRKYIPGTARKGLADVMGTFKGLSLNIEVKAGKDRQSEAQKKIESEVTASGGLYYLARNFSEFKIWFDNL